MEKMKDMKTYMKSRMESDSAEITTAAVLLWISFAIVLVVGVGSILNKSFLGKAKNMGDCIDKSNTLFETTAGKDPCMK